MRPVLKVKPRRSPFNTAEHDVSHGIEADGVHPERIFNGGGYFFESEGLQQAQHLDILPASVLLEAHLQQPPQMQEAIGYVRALFADREALDLIHGAIRLSAHLITRDPEQFASQVVGRLLPHHDLAAVKEFSERTTQGASKPWFRTLHATLHPPGTSLVRTLQGHTRAVNGVALREDGRRAVSASSDKTLKVWDVETGRELRTLFGHTNWVTGVALSGGRAVRRLRI